MTCDEIVSVIKSLKNNKAPGPDCISNEHLKYAGNSFISHIQILFYFIVKYESYRTGCIILLYKQKGKDKTDPRNYKGITLTSSLGKLFEKIILNRIKNWTESSDLKFPNPLQFGFCKNSGAQLTAWTLQECIHNFQSVLHATFLDDEIAFDRVWQDGVLYKRFKLGIKSKCWRIIRHSYTTACAYVAFQ